MRLQKAAALILCALLTGCGTPATPEPVPPVSSAGSQRAESPKAPEQTVYTPSSMEELLALVNENHRAVKKPETDFAAYIHPASGGNFGISGYGEAIPFVPETVLTQEQAESDVDILFRGLQITYGPYYHFGGDEAFGKAKERILAACAGQKPLTAGFFAGALAENLRFLEDGHFRVNGAALSQTILGYAYSGRDYVKTAQGFETAQGLKVESVDGRTDLEKVFRMAVSEAGDVVWRPVVMREAPADLSAPAPDIHVRYGNGSAETLSADPWVSGYREDGELVELHENQGIPVLFARNMGFDEARGDELGKAFLKYAQELKEEPVLIVDLRSNGGGNAFLPLKWFREYAGRFVPTNYAALKYWSRADMEAYSRETGNPYYASMETMTGIGGYEPVSDVYMKTGGQPDDFVENDRLLIVLTGKNTASAAEMFTDMARNLENTLIIGQNTYGCLVSNAYTVMYLPASGTAVQLGSDLCVFPEGDFQEFAGYQPDIWTSGDAEEAAVRLVKQLGKKDEGGEQR